MKKQPPSITTFVKDWLGSLERGDAKTAALGAGGAVLAVVGAGLTLISLVAMLTSSLAVGTLPALVGTAIFVGGAVMLDKAVDHGRMINANRKRAPVVKQPKPQPPAPLKVAPARGFAPPANKGFTALAAKKAASEAGAKEPAKETTPPKAQPQQQPKA